jgi:hypothetical protein
MAQVSFKHKSVPARQQYKLGPKEIRGLAQDESAMQQLGFGVDRSLFSGRRYGMDADLTPTITTPTISTPVQFLQQWLPGVVNVLTQALRSDNIMGTMIVGAWEDEEIVQQTAEWAANANIYGDHTQIPLASYNLNLERRTVVRFEQGVEVTRLEDARASRQQISSIEQKRAATARELNILRNFTSFFGYADGTNRTFGILNDPNLPAYINSPAGGGGNTTFASKTVGERISSLLLLFQALIDNSGTNVDPGTMSTVLTVPSAITTTFQDINDFGISVKAWLNENYPLCRVEIAPEFNGANGGASVMYLMAEDVPDSGTDGGEVITQLVPVRMFLLGSKQGAKSYVEDYTNATAGVLAKRPYAIQRMTGV